MDKALEKVLTAFSRDDAAGVAKSLKPSLFSKGFDVNAKFGAKPREDTLLCLAIRERKNPEIIAALLDNGADGDLRDGSGMSPLKYVDFRDKAWAGQVLALFKAKKANIDLWCCGGTLLTSAIYHKQSPEILKLIIESGANVNLQDADGKTPLHHIDTMDSEWAISAMKLLVSKGAKLNIKDLRGDTLLSKFIFACSVDVVEYLFKAGAKSNNAVRDAVRSGILKERIDLVEFFLDKGINIDAKDESGNTALIDICFLDGSSSSASLRMAGFLIDKGADVNATNNRGESALLLAAGNGSTELCKILIAKGARIDAKDYQGHTPLFNAGFAKYSRKRGRHDAVIELLLANGADGRCLDELNEFFSNQIDINSLDR